MASRKTLLSFGLLVIIIGFGMIAISLQSHFGGGSAIYSEYFRAFGLGILALGIPLTIGSLATQEEERVTLRFQSGHVAFIQVFIGSFLAIFLSLFAQFEGLFMKLLLLAGSIAGALTIAILVFGILKIRPIRRAVLGFLDWITGTKG